MEELGGWKEQEGTRVPEFFWKAKGAKQGPFKNESSIKTYSDHTRLIAVHWGGEVHVDPVSHIPGGRAQLGPLVITKYIDGATPQLLQAFMQNEAITNSEFIYVDVPPAKAGAATSGVAAQTAKIFTIKGTNGYVSKIEAGSTGDGRLLERVSIHFTHLTWDSHVGSTSTQWDAGAQV